MNLSPGNGPIGVFDSGFGGLTILRQIRELMPQYDFVYLGDNARTPYGTRSFETVYEFTRQAVWHLFKQGCQLVILGCNTASAKALRSIQQNDLPQWDSSRRVLGVIRPTVEAVGELTKTGHVGIFATPGTIASRTYELEIAKLYADKLTVTGEACPMWVPLVENVEHEMPGADYFVQQHADRLLSRDPEIDCIILGCTHYPLLLNKIRQSLPPHIRIIPQGDYVARSLYDYLLRHTDMQSRITCGGTVLFQTTESPDVFSQKASVFLGQAVSDVQKVTIDKY